VCIFSAVLFIHNSDYLCYPRRKQTVIHLPSPATGEEMEMFYQDLSQAVTQVPKGDMLLVMSNFNANVGRREPSAMSSAVGLRRNK